MSGTGNIFAGAVADPATELFTTLLSVSGVHIERIVSAGQATQSGQWLEQQSGEWVLLLQGAAALEIEGESALRELARGDYVWLPPHCRHRVAWTDAGRATIWLAVHVGGTS